MLSAPRPLYRLCLALVTAAVVAVTVSAQDRSLRQAQDRPNIVLIMTDDLGFADIGPYGGEIDTPNLDRLAAGGVRFQQFYNTAKCAQTRATLLSGRYFPEVGFRPPNRTSATIAEVLGASGYHTFMSGKWHLRGDPMDHGWDRYFGHYAGTVNFHTGRAYRGEQIELKLGRDDWFAEEGFYTTDVKTDFALQFLQEDNDPNDDKPFLLYMAYNAPHYPLQAKQADVEKYMDRYTEGWDELRRERHARQLELGIIPEGTLLSPRPPEVPAWSTLSEEQKAEHILTMATYAGMVDCVDQNIGRIIQHLESTGEFDNTIFIFLTDNGGCPFQRTEEETRANKLDPWLVESYWTYDEGWAHASNTPFRWYKQNQHEGGIASPFIVHWPAGFKSEPGSIVKGPGHLVDIAATLYDVTGATYPDEMDGYPLGALRGQSLRPILDGEIDTWSRELWQRFRGNRALRSGDWKVVIERNMPSDAWELFDLGSDPSEVNDLSEEKPALRRTLINRYEELDNEIMSHMPDQPAVDEDMH